MACWRIDQDQGTCDYTVLDQELESFEKLSTIRPSRLLSLSLSCRNPADPPRKINTTIKSFNNALSKAKKFFKGQRYALAAEQYGIALKLCDELPNHENKRTALYNNR